MLIKLLKGLFARERAQEPVVPEQLQGLEELEALRQLAPFIRAMDGGESLWRYVVTGDNIEALHSSGALLALDRVVVVLHAKAHAPDFFREIQRQVHSGIPSQSRLSHELDDALSQCWHDLVDGCQLVDAQRSEFMQCYLRILDIFFHILDQETLPDCIYEQLVEHPEHRLLDRYQFYQRYSLEAISEDEALPARTRKAMNILIRDVDDGMRNVSHQSLQKIERVFGENRRAYDTERWAKLPRGRLIIASFLLARDAGNSVFDDYTQNLQTMVEEQFFELLAQCFAYTGLKGESDFIDQLIKWLGDDSTELPEALLRQARSDLSANTEWMGCEHRSPLGDHLVDYTKLSRNSSFCSMLTVCYWLLEREAFSFAPKLLKFALALDTQRILAWLSQVHRLDGARGTFASEDLKLAFEHKLQSIGVTDAQLIAMNLAIAQTSDMPTYRQLIKQYGKKTRALWDTGIAELTASSAQRFYLDVCRFGGFFAQLDAQEKLGDLALILRDEIAPLRFHRKNALRSYFGDSDLAFCGWWSEFGEDREDCKLAVDTGCVSKFDGALIVLQEMEGSYRLLLSPQESTAEVNFLKDISAYDVVVFSAEVETARIYSAIAELAEPAAMEAELLELAAQYLADTLDYAHYRQRVVHLADFSGYQWTGEGKYKRATLLPLLLTEASNKRRNQLIKLFCPGGKNSADVEAIALELFLEILYEGGDIDQNARKYWSTEDLQEQGQETYEAFEAYRDKLVEQLDALG
ncbi:MAG: hypothetical protein ACPG4U_04970 [Pseudomonadales bacterium]